MSETVDILILWRLNVVQGESPHSISLKELLRRAAVNFPGINPRNLEVVLRGCTELGCRCGVTMRAIRRRGSKGGG